MSNIWNINVLVGGENVNKDTEAAGSIRLEKKYCVVNFSHLHRIWCPKSAWIPQIRIMVSLFPPPEPWCSCSCHMVLKWSKNFSINRAISGITAFCMEKALVSGTEIPRSPVDGSMTCSPSLYLCSWSLIFLTRLCRRSTVWPHAVFSSFHSTGILGSRPSRNPLMVPKCPECQMWKVALNTLVFFSLSSCDWLYLKK